MKEQIPKIIHYCWFGKKPLPKSVKKCIESWKKFCPGYKIVEWNEDNFDINCCQFIKDAYERKAWAFVSDFARLKIIHENGGIYLDTDVEVIRNLDELLGQSCFFARQQDRGYIGTGLGFGATKGHPTIKKLIDEYQKIDFKSASPEQIACPIIASNLLDKGTPPKQSDQIEYRDKYCIYSPEYFDPISHGDTEILLSEKSFSIHHYTASWTSRTNRFKRYISNSIGQATINRLKQYKKNLTRRIKDKATIKDTLYYYIIITAAFFPRGLSGVNTTYKIALSAITWMAIILICIRSVKAILTIIHNKNFPQLFGYFCVLAIITIILNGTQTTGLQQLFAYPIFFLFIIINIQANPKKMLNTMNNVSLAVLSMNLVLTHIFFTDSSHSTLIGHVQVISQIGALSIFTAIIYYILYKRHKAKLCILCLLSIFTMLNVDAISANLTAIFLLIVVLLYKYFDLTLFKSKAPSYIICSIIASIIIIAMSTNLNTTIKALDFSGRGIVWQSTLSNIQESPVYGYGLHGSEIKVFWNKWYPGSNKLTYAHNQILQNLLDGGIITLLAFWIMVFTCTHDIANMKDKRYNIVFNIFLITFLAISIFESPSSYCYIYIFLALCYSLPKVINNNGRAINEHN